MLSHSNKLSPNTHIFVNRILFCICFHYIIVTTIFFFHYYCYSCLLQSQITVAGCGRTVHNQQHSSEPQHRPPFFLSKFSTHHRYPTPHPITLSSHFISYITSSLRILIMHETQRQYNKTHHSKEHVFILFAFYMARTLKHFFF